MNGIAQLGKPILREVNFDPGLFVGMTVLDQDGSQIGSLIPMSNPLDTLYLASYTPTQEGNIVLRCAVYTDNTYTVLSPDYSRSSESHQVIDIGKLATASQVIGDEVKGIVMDDDTVTGYAEDDDEEVSGSIDC